ncbi:MAG: universal stress protein [Methanomicrobiales archaeon]|nr:universal stress protein [Methanomicrobiales archaeon]
MFERALLPTDFSPYSKKTIECVAVMPGVQKVTLMHVIDATRPSRHGWTHDREIENTKVLLAEQRKPLEEGGLTVSVELEVITSGDIASGILVVADRCAASLIVRGARGDTRITEILLGRVVEAVLRRSSASVLVMRHRLIEGLEGPASEKFCPGVFSKILVPTDFSEESTRAISLLAPIQGVQEILLLHAVTKGETKGDMDQDLRKAQRTLEESRPPGAGRIRTLVRVGDPVLAINQLSEEEDVSLIALGSHRTGILRELFHGSTVYDVAAGTDRPVLVVKPFPVLHET